MDDLRDRIAEALSKRFAAKNGSCDVITRQAHYDTAKFVMTIVGPELERLRKELADTRQAYERTFARMCEIETDLPDTTGETENR